MNGVRDRSQVVSVRGQISVLYHKHRAKSRWCPKKNAAGRDDFTAR